MIETVGYMVAVLIGISLGLIGGGGSILTVPVLVYLFHLPPKLATSYSLLIVGVTSLTASCYQYIKGYIHFRAGCYFGLTSVATTFLTRKYILPLVPHHLFYISRFEVTNSLAIMVLFALLMLLAAVSMISSNNEMPEQDTRQDTLALMSYGVSIGLVTGFLGAGGGFLIIPALVFFVKLPTKKAIGTSLFIVTVNSLVGFTADLGHYPIDWVFLTKILGFTLAGVVIGSIIGPHIAASRLKKGFGWFILMMGLFILAKEIYLALADSL